MCREARWSGTACPEVVVGGVSRARPINVASLATRRVRQTLGRGTGRPCSKSRVTVAANERAGPSVGTQRAAGIPAARGGEWSIGAAWRRGLGKEVHGADTWGRPASRVVGSG
jgi:hypothetical protein